MLALDRRDILRSGAALAATLAAPAVVRAAAEVNIGFWPIASGLPLFTGVARDVFKKAGLDVKPVKFESAQLVIEGMLTGRLQGSANGVASGLIALAELAKPGYTKIVCANPSNKQFVLDEFVVAADSPYQKISDLQGVTFASGPGIQNVTLAKICLEKNGIQNARVIELPLGQHVPALQSKQIGAAYTLEPVGTLGAMQGLTRTIETGVISTYVLGETTAPWFGGAASMTAAFIASDPALARRYAAAYGEAVALVREKPADQRPYLIGNTPITPALAEKVPLPDFTTWDKFTETDLDWFQKFYDVFVDRKLLRERVDVRSMMYKG